MIYTNMICTATKKTITSTISLYSYNLILFFYYLEKKFIGVITYNNIYNRIFLTDRK